MENIVSEDIFKALNRALGVYHEGRDINYYEATEVENAATWLKQELIKRLSIRQQIWKNHLKFMTLLHEWAQGFLGR